MRAFFRQRLLVDRLGAWPAGGLASRSSGGRIGSPSERRSSAGCAPARRACPAARGLAPRHHQAHQPAGGRLGVGVGGAASGAARRRAAARGGRDAGPTGRPRGPAACPGIGRAGPTRARRGRTRRGLAARLLAARLRQRANSAGRTRRRRAVPRPEARASRRRAASGAAAEVAPIARRQADDRQQQQRRPAPPPPSPAATRPRRARALRDQAQQHPADHAAGPRRQAAPAASARSSRRRRRAPAPAAPAASRRAMPPIGRCSIRRNAQPSSTAGTRIAGEPDALRSAVGDQRAVMAEIVAGAGVDRGVERRVAAGRRSTSASNRQKARQHQRRAQPFEQAAPDRRPIVATARRSRERWPRPAAHRQLRRSRHVPVPPPLPATDPALPRSRVASSTSSTTRAESAQMQPRASPRHGRSRDEYSAARIDASLRGARGIAARQHPDRRVAPQPQRRRLAVADIEPQEEPALRPIEPEAAARSPPRRGRICGDSARGSPRHAPRRATAPPPPPGSAAAPGSRHSRADACNAPISLGSPATKPERSPAALDRFDSEWNTTTLVEPAARARRRLRARPPAAPGRRSRHSTRRPPGRNRTRAPGAIACFR